MTDKALTSIEVMDMIREGVNGGHPDDLHTDDEGQVIVYTGIYRWKSDGSYHEEPETP